jgi:NADH-quinone oxidoreductase subunit F
MDETTDAVKACLSVVRFFAHESCGKCTPCREGTTWLERILTRILDGYGRPSDLALLMDVADNISTGIAWPPKQTTICPLGPSAVSPLNSALTRFRPEFEAYIRKGLQRQAASAPQTPIAVRPTPATAGAGHD